MKNPNIASRLRYYRQFNHLSVQDVADKLASHGNPVSTKSIYSWETGQTQPSADTLMYLCELYKIDDVLETFGYQNTSEEKSIKDTLTDEELALIIAFRKHPELKPAVLKLYDLKDHISHNL